MENYTFRLKPGQDLFDSTEAFVHEKRIIIFSTRPRKNNYVSPHP